MIINTGQRTDIPGFYSKWFIERIKAGYVLVRNPYNPTLITKYRLDPNIVDVIGFCTKNPGPMIKYLDILKPFGQFWYVTITPYDSDFEPNVPSIDNVINDFKTISKAIGKNKMALRVTPIIINSKYTKEYHVAHFKKLVEELHEYTNIFVFGFLDLYDKLKSDSRLTDANDFDKIYIANEFKKIAKEYNIDLRLCSKEKWLKDYGINVDGCMLLSDFERAIGERLYPKVKAFARGDYCSCFITSDIGYYNSCMHLCRYCYANGNKNLIYKNYELHDFKSPLLIGNINIEDKIVDATQESWKSRQISFDF